MEEFIKFQYLQLCREELKNQINIFRNAAPIQDPELELVHLDSHNQVLRQKVHDFQDIIESQKVQIRYFENERQNHSEQLINLNSQIYNTSR